MGNPKSKPKQARGISATELCASGIASAPRQAGRKLTFKFTGDKNPELDRAEFQYKQADKPTYWQRGHPQFTFTFTEPWQALALLVLEYICAHLRQSPEPFHLRGSKTGSLAASFGEALSNASHTIPDLFIERDAQSGGVIPRVKAIFTGDNLHGKLERDRRITISPDYLPPDCIEVFWEARGPLPLTKLADFQVLADRIRRALELPPTERAGESVPKATAPVEPPAPEATAKPPEPPPLPPKTPPEPTPPPKPPAQEPPPPPTGAAANPPPPQYLNLPPSFVKAFEAIAELAQRSASSNQPPTAEEKVPHPKSEATPSSTAISWPLPPPPPPINPQLFKIHNPGGLAWSGFQGLLDFGDGDTEDDIWRLKDACEGVLILGAPGSGKTSGSGFAFAQAFLTIGMGGLVLAAKPEEGRRWQSLCARFGRGDDCIVVTPKSPHKLNVLAYETQRPRDRLGLTDDLIAFFRVLIAIVSRRTAAQGKDDFWTNATNQLMRELFDVFLLAEVPMSIDVLTRFIALAPEQPTEHWREIPLFGEVLAKAQQAIRNSEDQRIYDRVHDYWTVTYPRIAHPTRSGIVLGFTAMANALSGRGIHELISSETTLTPEMILSGKIVILDLPLKEYGQGGLLVQAAWKYLFQRAVERRADKGRETARPVFLWSDEGHLFFSQHDIDFQPTARDCRAAHIIISQSLHNFYQLGHSPHAVQGVFATMNTQVFHANGDLETNQWASEKLGTTIKTMVNVSVSTQPKRPAEPKHWFWDAFKPEERESTASTSINQHREKVFQPESFALLKKGGDGTCEAVILWVSHQFQANHGRPFRVTVFAQDDNQPFNP